MEKITRQEGRKQVELIKKCWKQIEYCLSSKHWGEYGRNYMAENYAEEKQHDKLRPEGTCRFLSIIDASKLFCVRTLVEYLYTDSKLDAKDYLWVRKTHFFAYALANEYKKDLKECLEKIKGFDYKQILDIDYAKLQEIESEG